jgi:NADH-quinone oxidoreductase subunit A
MPVLVLAALAVGLAATLLALSHYAGPRNPRRRDEVAYECGIEPVGDARGRFPVRFYLVAMLFVAFDVEVAFLYPWAVLYRRLGVFGFLEMLVFVAVLLVGLYYAWRKGVFQWQ